MPLLSVLDQSPVRSGGAPAAAIPQSLQLAPLADPPRYPPNLAGPAPPTPGPRGGEPPEVIAMPSGPTVPEVWLLGSSDVSAALAAHFGTAFSFAHFINDEGGAPITRGYAAAFRPSPLLSAPRASVAVFVVCADSEAEALRLARSRDLFVVRLYTGRAGPYPSVEEAEAYPYAARELRIVEQARRRTIAGAPAEVRERLRALADAYGVDELVIVTITHDPKARRRSYELLARVFGLGEGAP